jgi:hypothetical protein
VDLYDGYFFSRLMAVPISNYRTDKWLTVTRVQMSEGYSPVESNLYGVTDDEMKATVAPGQTRIVIIQVQHGKYAKR